MFYWAETIELPKPHTSTCQRPNTDTTGARRSECLFVRTESVSNHLPTVPAFVVSADEATHVASRFPLLPEGNSFPRGSL
jgi:hypothetical protein